MLQLFQINKSLIQFCINILQLVSYVVSVTSKLWGVYRRVKTVYPVWPAANRWGFINFKHYTYEKNPFFNKTNTFIFHPQVQPYCSLDCVSPVYQGKKLRKILLLSVLSKQTLNNLICGRHGYLSTAIHVSTWEYNDWKHCGIMVE